MPAHAPENSVVSTSRPQDVPRPEIITRAPDAPPAASVPELESWLRDYGVLPAPAVLKVLKEDIHAFLDAQRGGA